MRRGLPAELGHLGHQHGHHLVRHPTYGRVVDRLVAADAGQRSYVDGLTDGDRDPRAQDRVAQQPTDDALLADHLLRTDERHWHDRRTGADRESYGAGLRALGPVLRVAGDPALGEQADRLAGGERGGGRIE